MSNYKSPYCVFSFGGGVQSSALYLMLIHEPAKLLKAMGELPQKVFFADTGAETEATYKALEHMQAFKAHWFEIETVTNGNILTSTFADGNLKIGYPAYIKNGVTGKIGMGKRFCTRNYKIEAVQKATRETFKIKKIHLRPNTVSMWLGISTDEIDRVAESPDKWIKNSYPLIELGMSREDCIKYCIQHNWTPAKSRCYICPYQSDDNWLDMKVNNPGEFEKACLIDEQIRHITHIDNSTIYLHRSATPLRKVQFKGGQHWDIDECSGHCGT